MNKTEIENKVYNDIVGRKQDAEHQADVRYYKALQNPDFEAVDKAIRASIIEKAKIEFDGGDAGQVNDKIINLKSKRDEILRSMGMTLQDIRPQYSCPLCKDTGFVGNARCSCFQNAVTKLLFENSNLSSAMTHTFKDFDCNVYDNKDFAKKLLT